MSDTRSPAGHAGWPSTDVPVTDARARIAELVGRTQHAGERIVLTKHGRPAAVLVPVADLERLLALERDAAAGPAVRESVQIPENSEVVWWSLLGPRSREAWWPGVLLDDHVGGSFVERWGDGEVTRGEVRTLVEDETRSGTTVHVTHSGWAALPDGDALRDRHAQGWREILDAWRSALVPTAGGTVDP